MNSIFTNLKRRSRSRKHELTSPSKAKPLDILPGLTEEEEEPRLSIASIQSLPTDRATAAASTPCTRSSAYATLGTQHAQDIADRKRSSRRVVLTGAEGLTFDDFFTVADEPPRPAPLPPTTRLNAPIAQPRPLSAASSFSSKSLVCDGSLDELDFKFTGFGVEVDFPSPPSMSRSPQRSQSPTPSCASSSSNTSSTFSIKSDHVTTPVTSDDESHAPKTQLLRAPKIRSQRASVIYIGPSERMEQDNEEDMSDAEDASWIAQEIGSVFSMVSVPPTPPATNTDTRVRPDSIPPPPRLRTAGRSRFSKPLPVPPRLSIPPLSICGPSIQLDPMFPPTNQRRRHFIPSRPPPPPPIHIDHCPSPTMEEKTDELLRLLANAALDSGFRGTGLTGQLSPLPPSAPVSPSSTFIPDVPTPMLTTMRPPPRSTIPADVDTPEEDAAVAATTPTPGACFEFELDGLMPSPNTSTSADTHSEPSLSPSGLDFEFDLDLYTHQDGTTVPDSPCALAGRGTGTCASAVAPERVLRSRWSCSTLASVDARQVPHSAASWMHRFNLTSPKKEKPEKAEKSHRKGRSSLGFSLRSPTTSSFFHVDVKPPVQNELRHKHSSSRLSDCGSDSGDSTASSGLRRKPIPIEIFMRH